MNNNEATIEHINEVIGIFMGGVKQVIPQGGLHGYKEGTVLWMYLFSNNPDAVTYLDYHTSWEWLMDVVEKIEAMGYKFQICRRRAEIKRDVEYLSIILSAKEETKKEAVYSAVYRFIQWYNQQTKPEHYEQSK